MTKTNLAEATEALRRRRVEIEAEYQEKGNRLTEDVNTLRDRVKSDEATTGDRITDYLLVMGNTLDPDVSKPLRNIEKQMSGKKGELFLVVHHEKTQTVFRGPNEGVRSSDFHPIVEHTIGLLTGEEIILDFKKSDTGLPTDSYVELSGSKQVDKKPGPFPFVVHGISDFPRDAWGLGVRDSRQELFVGDEAVLGYSPLPNTFPGDTRIQEWVVIRNRAIRSLGKDIPEAPEEKAFREECQKKVLDDLDRVRGEYKTVVSHRPHSREAERLEAELRALLTRALELGLDKKPLVLLVMEEMEVPSAS